MENVRTKCCNCGSRSVSMKDVYGREFNRGHYGTATVVKHIEMPVCAECGSIALQGMPAAKLLDDSVEYAPRSAVG